MKVYLIRHAKIELDETLVQTTQDAIVTDDETIKAIKQIVLIVPNPDKIYCSKLKRAKQTVSLIYPKRRDIIYTTLLNEYVRPSRYIGKNKDELIRFWEVDHKNDKYDPHWKPEDGESYFECAQRAEKFYNQLVKDKNNNIDTVSIIGHGTLFRHLICPITGVMEWKHNPRIVIDLLRKFAWNHLEFKIFEI